MSSLSLSLTFHSCLVVLRPPSSTLFPYTTLFRSELNALHTKRQNLFQELDAVIHLLMEAKHWITASSSDRKSGSAGMPRPTSYAVFCLKKKTSLLASFGSTLTTSTLNLTVRTKSST